MVFCDAIGDNSPLEGVCGVNSVDPCAMKSCGWLRVDTMLLMRDDDGQLMTCQREDVSLDPADEVVDPRILRGWWLPCGSSLNGGTTL